MAYEQTLKIGNRQKEILESDKITNYRFYINTPYFDSNGSDPYPLLNLMIREYQQYQNLFCQI